MPAAVGLKVHDILAHLETDGHVTVREIPWLVESCKTSKTFWGALIAHASTLTQTPIKSVPFESYDFYSDLIKRHPPERPAFRWYDSDENRFETFTVGELDMLCSRRAKEWEGRGVSSGQTVAIMMPMGPDFAISLLTALKIGALVTIIAPRGEVAIKKILETAAPDHIATDPIYLRYLGDMKDKAIPPDLPPATEGYDTSGVYATNTPWAKLVSPFAEKPFDAAPVPCDSGYLWALRDGIIAFGLKPKDTLLAPALPLSPAQPSLLVATLLAGGTYCHIDLDQVKAKPAVLDAVWKHVIVTRELRDLILDAGVAKVGRSWKSWSRFVDEGGDPARWAAFVVQSGLEASQSCNYLVDSAAGGGLCFSMKRKLSKGGWNNYILPGAGTEWWLSTAAGKPARTFAPFGRFTFKKPGEDEPPPGTNVVRKEKGELQFLGPATPHRGGRTYPTEQVLAAIDPLPFVLESSVVPVPTGDLETPYHFSLVIFCGHELKRELGEQAGEWRGLIEGAIKKDLGVEALPDVIDFFPLYARRKEGLTDHDWVRAAYMTGSLHERARSEPYTLITELRAIVFPWTPPQAIPPPAPPGDAPPPEESPPADAPPPEEPPPSDSPPPDAPPPEGSTEAPPSDAPPSDAPPSDSPPSDAPPAETSPWETPPSDAPPSDAPPSDAPPEGSTEVPPSDAPPSDAPPEGSTEAPPADAPASDAPASDAPPEGSTEAPPADAPPADAPVDAPSSDAPASDTPTPDTPPEGSPDSPPGDTPPAETQQAGDGQESGSGPIPNVESDVMLIVDDDAELPPEPPAQDPSTPPTASE